jgi:hypothetical protein
MDKRVGTGNKYMKIELVKNRLGINLIKHWGRGLPTVEINANDHTYTASNCKGVIFAYSSYTIDRNFIKLENTVSNFSAGFSQVLTLEDAIWNDRLSNRFLDAFINIFAKLSGIEFNDWIEFHKTKIEVFNSFDKKIHNIFLNIFRSDPDIATLFARFSPQDIDIISPQTKHSWLEKINGKEIEFDYYKKLLAVENFKDIKNWLDNFRIVSDYPFILKKSFVIGISDFEYRDKFMCKALGLDSCKTKATTKILTAVGTPRADCYFLSITGSRSQYGADIQNIFSTAVFCASSVVEVAEKLIDASFVTTSNIIVCLNYRSHPKDPYQFGWWESIDEPNIEISIGEKNVFFVCFDEYRNSERRFDDLIQPLGFNLEKIGPIKFVRKKEFEKFKIIDMHQSLVNQLINKMIN